PRRSGPGSAPGFVRYVHPDQDVPRKPRTVDEFSLTVLDLGYFFGRDHDLVDIVFGVQRNNPVLEIGFDAFFHSRIGVDDVPVADLLTQMFTKLSTRIGHWIAGTRITGTRVRPALLIGRLICHGLPILGGDSLGGSLRLLCWIGHKKSLPFLTEHLEHNFTDPHVKSRNDRHHDHHQDRAHDEVIDHRRTIRPHYLAEFGDHLTI